MMTKVQ